MRSGFVNHTVLGLLLLCQLSVCSDFVPWVEGLASADERPRPAADPVVTASQRGANDNAIGTAGVLEMTCVLAQYTSESTIRFLWCNEGHTPWTSKIAAQKAKARGDNIVAVFNLDGIGAKTAEQTAAGKKPM